MPTTSPRITVVPLAEDICAADPGLLSPFYADDATFDGFGTTYCIVTKTVDEEGAGLGLLPERAKSLFILDTPEQK